MVVNMNYRRKRITNISRIIDSLTNMIVNKDIYIENTDYFYHAKDRQEFIISLYLLKLLINNFDYIKNKHLDFLKEVKGFIPDRKISKEANLKYITNFNVRNSLELIKVIREYLKKEDYSYNFNEQKLYFNEIMWVDAKWLMAYLALVLDNKKGSTEHKDIKICYTIPEKETKKITDINDLDYFLSQFTYYDINVKYSDKVKAVKENNILVLKNAAINYLKHLKQYIHGLESEETYLIFYNLLKNECYKQGFILEEEIITLNEIDPIYLKKVKDLLPDNFIEFQLSKQVHTIENVIWKLSNDLNVLQHLNRSFDSTIDFISLIYKKLTNTTYNNLKSNNKLRDIQILLILIIHKFTINYLVNDEELDYGLLDLSSVKPEYMNLICVKEETEIKGQIESLESEINKYKHNIEKYKQERLQIDRNVLGPEKYLKELERCVGSINRTSINITKLIKALELLNKEYEELRLNLTKKYKNLDLYSYNYSIIKHISNSIITCNFYLKTNNNNNLLDNIIIFEDYIKNDNAFYLEITFRELLKISSQNVIAGIAEQSDLPKLAK